MLIHELTLRGILSFAVDTPPLELRSLNLLIGPNGSGKSNLLEAIGLLRSSASDLTVPLRGTGGGVTEWLWKGLSEGVAEIEAVSGHPGEKMSLSHRIVFQERSSTLEVVAESVKQMQHGVVDHARRFPYQFQNGRATLLGHGNSETKLKRQDLRLDQSILSQWKSPSGESELSYLSKAYSAIRMYREWTFGRNSIFRRPQAADMPGDRLEEDFSNLGLFLNHLRGKPKAKKAIIERLRDLYEGLDDFDVRVKGGTVEVFLTEGDFTIPASRLSDGTLRYLCLLAILCDPDPPPLICIEEPELGLHPDMLPKIADLLITASERTQLIVTTHSDMLVDAMTEQPESVVVMEKHNGKTVAKRLQNDAELKGYLDDYRLGEAWLRGLIGGTRW